MRLGTPAEMIKIEKRTAREFGISEEVQMETAGALVTAEIENHVRFKKLSKTICILCGPGNNGADGLTIARHLQERGFLHQKIFLWGKKEKRTALFNLQLARALKENLVPVELTSAASFEKFATKRYGLIVDAIYGTGFKIRAHDLSLQLLLKQINRSGAEVWSVDIPTGLDALSGFDNGECIRASQTFTFGLAKPGLFVSKGPQSAGKVKILKIGFPQVICREEATRFFTFGKRNARRALPVREKQSNKSQHGHLVIVAGSPGMWGAAQLCSEAAYRMGAGYVSLGVSREGDFSRFMGAEIGSEVLVKLKSDLTLFSKATAVVIGPGAGANNDLEKVLLRMLEEKIKKVVVDADALTVLSKMKGIALPKDWILTPHSGELSRLLGVSSTDIEKDRFYFVQKAAEKYGCIVLLKGFRTLIGNSESKVAIVTSGNAALAKAGTGDVLSGFIGSLLAQGVNTVSAAGAAAYLHGCLADDWIKEGLDQRSLMPRDLLSRIPNLLRKVTGEK